MASVFKKQTKEGIRYCIQLSPGENKSRPKISLGKRTAKDAWNDKTNIELLILNKNTNSAAVQEWLSNINDGLRKRLTSLGIIKPSNSARNLTVTEWVKQYIESRPDVKQGTRRKYHDVESILTAFFKNDFIDSITAHHAKNFRVYMQATMGLSENSIRRYIGITRQFFNSAIEAEIINKNPFRGQPVSVRANPERFFYVTQDMADKVLDACPDAQWRLIFGLARWGGLRCPSEVLRLNWQDVDFEHSRFTVHSDKTEHHADGGIRTVPMFSELKPLFQDAFDNAKEGDIYCITRYRDKSVNLRTQLTKIIKRAGIDAWPKLFQNMRSTRETELFKMTGGNVKAVCSWIGNSPAVALQHYAQITETDMQEAAKMSLASHEGKKRVHNRVQNQPERPCNASQETQEETVVSPDYSESKQEFAGQCENMQKDQKWAIQESNL